MAEVIKMAVAVNAIFAKGKYIFESHIYPLLRLSDIELVISALFINSFEFIACVTVPFIKPILSERCRSSDALEPSIQEPLGFGFGITLKFSDAVQRPRNVSIRAFQASLQRIIKAAKIRSNEEILAIRSRWA